MLTLLFRIKNKLLGEVYFHLPPSNGNFFQSSPAKFTEVYFYLQKNNLILYTNGVKYRNNEMTFGMVKTIQN